MCCGIIFQGYDYTLGQKKVCVDLASLGNDFGLGDNGVSSMKVDPGCAIEAFKGINFTGETKIFSASASTALGAWNDKILSLKVRPACCGTIFQNYDYKHHGLVGGQTVCGALASLSSDFLGSVDGLNKGISSLKVDPGCVIEAFRGANFAGGKNIFTASTGNVGEWNDNILSLKVRPA